MVRETSWQRKGLMVDLTQRCFSFQPEKNWHDDLKLIILQKYLTLEFYELAENNFQEIFHVRVRARTSRND